MDSLNCRCEKHHHGSPVVSWIWTKWNCCRFVLLLFFHMFRLIIWYCTGSLAAAFQSFMYGGATPAGSIFATLTSMAIGGAYTALAAEISFVIAMVTVVFT